MLFFFIIVTRAQLLKLSPGRSKLNDKEDHVRIKKMFMDSANTLWEDICIIQWNGLPQFMNKVPPIPKCLKDPSALISRMPCMPSSSSVLECLNGLNALSACVLWMSSKFLSAFRMQKILDNISNPFCPNKQWHQGGIVLVELAHFIYLCRL